MSTSNANPLFGGSGSVLLGITWSECAVCTLLLTIHLFYRLRTSSFCSLFNPATFLSWVIAFASQALLSAAVLNAAGSSFSIIQHNDTLLLVLKYSELANALAQIATGLAKIALVSQLLKSIPAAPARLSAPIILLATSTAIVDLVYAFFLFSTSCDSSTSTQSPVMTTSCQHTPLPLTISAGAWSAVTTIIFAAGSLFLFLRRPNSRRIRASTSAFAAILTLAAVSAAVRTWASWQADPSPDPSSFSILPLLFSLTEVWLTLVATALPLTLSAPTHSRTSSLAPIQPIRPTEPTESQGTTPDDSWWTTPRLSLDKQVIGMAVTEEHKDADADAAVPAYKTTSDTVNFSRPRSLDLTRSESRGRQTVRRPPAVGTRSASHDAFNVDHDIIMETEIVVRHEPVLESEEFETSYLPKGDWWQPGSPVRRL